MTTYNDISYSSTSYNNCLHGRIIYANNTDIYANSEDYYADGSLVMRDISYSTTNYTDISYP